MEVNKTLLEKKNSLIEELLKKYNNIETVEQENNLQSNPSFLQIIGRMYDEALISRTLAYVLKKDKFLVWKLIVFYAKSSEKLGWIEDNCPLDFKVIKVQCEKSMLNGRADIFVKASDSKNNYTLTIENKIFSWEHDEQTKTYYNFVNMKYKKDSLNTYLFLKPNFNASPISCKEFKPIFYDELIGFISETEDYTINDFKKHIKEHLTVKDIKLTKVDIQVLKNLPEIRNLLKETEDKLTMFKRQVFTELCNGCINELKYNPYIYKSKKGKEEKNAYLREFAEKNSLVVELADEETVFQIYRASDKDDQWYYYSEGNGRNDSYYFFVELKFEGNDPNNIVVQKLVRRYGPKAKESIVDKYIKNNGICGEWAWDYWYIFSKDKFYCDEEILSPIWKDKLLKWASETLNNYIKDMELIFENFKEWKSNKETE